MTQLLLSEEQHGFVEIMNDILDLSNIEANEFEMGTATSLSPSASRTALTCVSCLTYLESRWRLCPVHCARSPSTASSPCSSSHLPPSPPPAPPLLPTLPPPDTAHRV